MTKKSKEFKNLLKQNKRERLRQKTMKQLQQRFKQSPFAELSQGLLVEPEGEVKMSEVLREFVEPYQATANNVSRLNKLFELAAMAWNLAISDDFDLDEIIEEMINLGAIQDNSYAKQEIKEILAELIARKKEHFADYKKLILDFELQGTGRDMHLSVVSTPIN